MKDGVKARYTLEFKREAVRLVHVGEKVSAVARTLGVSGQSLDNWVKAEAAGRLRDVRGKAVTAEQMEIARLKAELSRVRMERDFQKKRRYTSGGSRGEVCLYRATSWHLALILIAATSHPDRRATVMVIAAQFQAFIPDLARGRIPRHRS